MTIAFVDGSVIVGDGRVLENATVLVEGESIAKVTEGNFSTPKSAQKIPMNGQTLSPANGSLSAW